MMDEEQARDWVREQFGQAAVDTLSRLVALVVSENERQNLVARSTTTAMWTRHVADSAQLLLLRAPEEGMWIDVGTGGGFPGMVVALLRAQPMLLVEPRRKRADFLRHAIADLALTHVKVAQSSIQRVDAIASVISARAVSDTKTLIDLTQHCATEETTWLLPRGRYDGDVRNDWAGPDMVFHVKQSVTDINSAILVGRRR